MLFRRAKVSLYIFFFFFSYFLLFLFFFSLFSRFSFLLSDQSSDLNWDLELDECKSKLKFMSKFQWNLGNFMEFVFFLVLITISMNLFDQVVIVICDPDFRGSAPSRKNLSLGLLFVVL